MFIDLNENLQSDEEERDLKVLSGLRVCVVRFLSFSMRIYAVYRNSYYCYSFHFLCASLSFLCMQYRNQIQREPRIHSDCDPVVQKSINFGYHMLSRSWDSRSRMSRQGMLKEGKMFC